MTTILTLYNEVPALRCSSECRSTKTAHSSSVVSSLQSVSSICFAAENSGAQRRRKRRLRLPAHPAAIGDAGRVFQRIYLSVHDGIHRGHSLLDRAQEPALAWSPCCPGHQLRHRSPRRRICPDQCPAERPHAAGDRKAGCGNMRMSGRTFPQLHGLLRTGCRRPISSSLPTPDLFRHRTCAASSRRILLSRAAVSNMTGLD